MLIMTQDRISGLATEKPPLSTYGPGNTRDESNRNSWVSSDGDDQLSINCFGQVNGLFLGRYQADAVKLTFQGDEMFGNKTSSGFAAVGYANGTNGVISGTISAIEQIPTGYYYSVGTLVTITLNSASTYINVNDLITINGTSSLATEFDGFHRVVQVQQDTSFTRLNNLGNSVFFQTQGASGSKIQVIVRDNILLVNGYLSVNDTCTIENGISVELLPQGINNAQCGIIVDEDDINFHYSIRFGHAQSSLLKSGDSPFTVGEYITFEDSVIRTNAATPVVTEDLVFSSNSYKSYYVSATDAASSNFTVFVEPGTFLASNLVSVITPLGSPKANLGSSFTYSGGGYQHRLGLGLIAGATLSSGSEQFENNEVIELSSPSIATVSLASNGIKQLELNGILQTFLHKTTIKDRFQFSVKLPYKFKTSSGGGLIDNAFLFGAGDSIELRKYVIDTDDARTTVTGAGTPIRRVDVATRTQNTVADFVAGRLSRVESNYIPLPREAFPTKIILDFDATLNHNAANLFNEFLLEEVTIEHPETEASLTTEDSSDYTSYKTDVSSYYYNSDANGELVLYLNAASTTIVEDDFIFLKWDNNVNAQNAQITKNVHRINDTTIQADSPIHELYEGMKFDGTNDKYILSFHTTTNQITLNIAHGITAVPPSAAVPVTLDHHPNLGSEAQNAWNGFHRVISSTSNGTIIKIVVPNAGVKGDLTINSTAYTSNPSLYTTAGATVYVTKVSDGKGRFIRPINTGITQASAFLWNSHPTNTATYNYALPSASSQEYEILPKTGRLIFSSPHSLVNNDKIVIYDVNNATNAANIKGLKSSYLVTYTTSNTVTIELDEASSATVSALAGDAANIKRLVVICSSDHGFSVGEKVSLNKMPNSPAANTLNGVYTIETTPTSKSFTVISVEDIGSSYNPTIPAGCEAITGVHDLVFGQTYSTNSTASIIQNLKSSRSVSISDAISAFEAPIQVGNLIYRDALQYSSGVYEAANDATATFLKTPSIDDAASTSPYRPDSDTAIQNTFAGNEKSVVSQIKLIVGDATSEKNIQLVKPFGILGEPYVFTKLLQSLRLAIVRAGVSRTLPNPQVGVSNNFKDYSVRKELPTGAYYYLNRDSAKEFQGRLISDPESIDLLVDFGAEQLARPFPCLVISGNEGNMKKLRTRTALYGYFTALPAAVYSNKLVNLKEASFSIREVL